MTTHAFTTSLCVMMSLLIATAPARGAEEEKAPIVGPVAPSKLMLDLADRLVGTYEAGERTLHIAELRTVDLPPSFYVEVTLKQRPLEPIWAQIWSVREHSDDAGMELFVNEFPRGLPLRNTYIGMWAAPEYLPRLSSAFLSPVGRLNVNIDHATGDVTFASTGTMSTFHAGAWTAEYEFVLMGDQLLWTVVGYNVDGETVWGDSEQAIEFIKTGPLPTPEITSDQLVIIRLREGEGIPVEAPDSVAVHTTGYLMNGIPFRSTRAPGMMIDSTAIPSDRYPRGWTLGILGMKKGGVRRLIVPPHLGAGSEGRGPIPPNSPLIYDIELIAVKDN